MIYRLCLSMIIFLSLAACITPKKNTDTSSTSDAEVTISQLSNGEWSVEYHFSKPASLFIFPRSNGDYRRSSWKPVNDNVTIERNNDLDVMSFARPITEARFIISPHFDPIEQDYTPYIDFGTSGIAVYSGQFSLLPVSSRQKLNNLDASLQTYDGPDFNVSMTLQSDMPIILDGKVHKALAIDRDAGVGRYVFTGSAPLQRGNSFIGVIDPTFPNWVKRRIDNDLSFVFAELDKRWGAPLQTKASVLFSYEGHDAIGLSTTGGALDNMLAMQAGGAAMTEPSKAVSNQLLWFFAHEAAHLYQFSNGLGFDTYSNAWIFEGGANTMAHEIVASSHENPKAYLTRAYSDMFADCVSALQDGPLTQATDYGHYFADYSCGDLIHVIIKSELDDGDIYALWKDFLSNAAPQSSNSNLTHAFLWTAKKRGVSEKTIFQIKSLISEPQQDPAKMIANLLMDVQAFVQVDENGRVDYYENND